MQSVVDIVMSICILKSIFRGPQITYIYNSYINISATVKKYIFCYKKEIICVTEVRVAGNICFILQIGAAWTPKYALSLRLF